LVKLGFSHQFNCKADEGSKHPDRNAQFEYSKPRSVGQAADITVPWSKRAFNHRRDEPCE
jgi:hypothetical protein